VGTPLVITRPHAFRVYGEPAPKGSIAGRVAKNGRVILSEQVNRNRPWRRAIEKAAPIHITERAEKGQAIRITLLFALTRTQAAAGRTRPTTQSAQKIGGDLDKLARLVLDALESCAVLANDAQVVELTATKVYADSPEWMTSEQWVRRGRREPGMYCRIEPVGYVPPELPYAERLDEHEQADGYHP
jgi:crossover junction endodeoxyribonuclease RusA